MKIEKHNAHGSQLLVSLTTLEALTLARKLVDTASRAMETKVNHYVSIPCQFEDDNDRWEPTDLDVVVETSNPADCRPTYPCGKAIVQGAMTVCHTEAGLLRPRRKRQPHLWLLTTRNPSHSRSLRISVQRTGTSFLRRSITTRPSVRTIRLKRT